MEDHLSYGTVVPSGLNPLSRCLDYPQLSALNRVHNGNMPTSGSTQTFDNPAGTLAIKDSRTGTDYILPVADDAIRASDLKKIKTNDPDDLGIVSYDPAFLNTASCRSAITYIDGDKGILRYRGY